MQEFRRIRSLGEIYREHFHAGRQERMFISSVAFFVGFAGARTVTHAIRRNIGPFHNFATRGGTHIHHAVFGITGLLLVGYLWNAEVGTRADGAAASRLTAAVFGLGSALTLDEFALWLNLKDVYWERQGRESIDAVVLFGAVLSAAFWGKAFLRDVSHEVTKLRSPRDVTQLASSKAR